jgi:hypothetical protein
VKLVANKTTVANLSTHYCTLRNDYQYQLGAGIIRNSWPYFQWHNSFHSTNFLSCCQSGKMATGQCSKNCPFINSSLKSVDFEVKLISSTLQITGLYTPVKLWMLKRFRNLLLNSLFPIKSISNSMGGTRHASATLKTITELCLSSHLHSIISQSSISPRSCNVIHCQRWIDRDTRGSICSLFQSTTLAFAQRN